MKEILKTRLLESIEICDTLASYSQKLQGEVNESAKVLSDKSHEEGAEAEAEVDNYIDKMMTFFLLQEDMNRQFTQLIALYKLAKEVGIDNDLTDTQKDRMEFLLESNVTLFIVDKGEVIPEDKEVIDMIVNQKKTDSEFKQMLLTSIREKGIK